MEAANVYKNRYQSTAKEFNAFCKLFGVWKGSVIKLLWHDLLIFLIIYAGLSVIYRNVFLHHTANVFAVNFTGFPCVPLKPCKVHRNNIGKGVKHNSL